MPIRSGDRLQTTSLVTNLLMSVVAPFVTFGIVGLQTRHPGLSLPDGYDSTVLLLLATCLNYAAQAVHMWRIRREAAPEQPVPVPDPVPLPVTPITTTPPIAHIGPESRWPSDMAHAFWCRFCGAHVAVIAGHLPRTCHTCGRDGLWTAMQPLTVLATRYVWTPGDVQFLRALFIDPEVDVTAT